VSNEENPFANWPYLGARRPRDAPATANEALGGAEAERDAFMSRNNAVEEFLGGSPGAVFVKLLLVSLVVGALMMWLEIRPADIFHGIVNFVNRIYALGFGAIREVIDYVAAGAVIVVPAWFVLRLLNAPNRR
jgi:hypothetical protein